jgi:hypothetical protein
MLIDNIIECTDLESILSKEDILNKSVNYYFGYDTTTNIENDLSWRDVDIEKDFTEEYDFILYVIPTDCSKMYYVGYNGEEDIVLDILALLKNNKKIVNNELFKDDEDNVKTTNVGFL